MLFLALSPGRTDFATTKAVVDAELAAGAFRARERAAEGKDGKATAADIWRVKKLAVGEELAADAQLAARASSAGERATEERVGAATAVESS